MVMTMMTTLGNRYGFEIEGREFDVDVVHTRAVLSFDAVIKRLLSLLKLRLLIPFL